MRILKIVGLALVIGLIVTSCNGHEGGVRVANNMEAYAIEYNNTHNLLEEDESVMAYYDYTISLDGSEAAILTNSRLIYHNEETSTSSIMLEDVTDVTHRYEKLLGDIIEVSSVDGNVFVIEIAPLNGGETFINVLEKKISSYEVEEEL